MEDAGTSCPHTIVPLPVRWHSDKRLRQLKTGLGFESSLQFRGWWDLELNEFTEHTLKDTIDFSLNNFD